MHATTTYKLCIVCTGRVVAARVDRPRDPWRRHMGLLVRPPLAPDEALWLDPCGGIHTWGMAYPIDALFLDREMRVLRVARNLQPWRMALAPRGTRSVVELRAGAATGIEPGLRLEFLPDR